jgi:hypothetical protein
MVQILLNMVSLQKESSGINVGRLPAMVEHLFSIRINVIELALHLPEVVNINRLTFGNRLNKFKVGDWFNHDLI